MALPLDIGGLPREIQIPFEQIQKEHPFGTEDIRDKAATTRKVLLDTQRDYSSCALNIYNTHTAAGTSTVVKGLNGAGGNLSLTYTPVVDVWWEVSVHIGQYSANSAAWNYMQIQTFISAGTIPAVAGMHMGGAAPTIQAATINYGHSAGTVHHSHVQKFMVPLSAGVTYTTRTDAVAGGGNWSIVQGVVSGGSPYIYTEGVAWAR